MPAMESPLRYTFISIATNRYSNYLLELLNSSRNLGRHLSEIEWVIFTDSPEFYDEIREEIGLVVKVIKIPSYNWPEATLFRYKIFRENFDQISGDYVIYLDADMELVSDFIENIEPENWDNGVALVSHPGYWRTRNYLSRIKLYLQNPYLLIKDSYRFIRVGSLGAWETNKKSTAFTPRKDRENYVCGGTWMGSSESIRKLVTELSQNVEEDAARGVMALWHDESHLNKWSASNKFTLLTPRFCHDKSYPGLSNLSPLIRAVDKRIE